MPMPISFHSEIPMLLPFCFAHYQAHHQLTGGLSIGPYTELPAIALGASLYSLAEHNFH